MLQSPAAQLLTKAVTTAVISAVGNIFCQLVVEGRPSLDARRLAIFTGLGFAWVAPALHTWFALVNRLVPAAGNTGAHAAKQGAARRLGRQEGVPASSQRLACR